MMPFDFFTGYQPNPLFTPVSGPPIDTDPNSPTYGQPTTSNLRVPPNVPDTGTTAKGNRGQPAPNVPTTDAANAPPPQVVGNEPGGGISYKFVPPPAASAKPVAAAPSILRNLQPQVDEHGTAPAAPAEAAPSTSVLRNLQPQVTEHGEQITPTDTGQYLTSATSPGAKAVGTAPLEGFELGPAAQAKIGLATDSAQRVRIAASQAGVTPDSIIVGSDGRLSAVGKNGVPYYLTPQPISAGPMTDVQPGVTEQGRPAEYTRPLANLIPQAFTTGNLVRGAAAELPGATADVLSLAPAVAEPLLGPATPTAVGAATVLAQGGRQALANLYDPGQRSEKPNWVTLPTLEAAGVNALLTGGGMVVNRLVAPAAAPSPALSGGPTPFGPTPVWRFAPDVPIEYPLGPRGGGRLPWENPLVTELPPTEAGTPGLPAAPAAAPSSPVPSAAPSAAAPVSGVPIPAAAAPTTVKTDAQLAAEDRAVPTDVPPLRFPLRGQAAIDARAREIVRWYAQNGNLVPEPGATGTLAQVTGNRGVAALERGMRDNAGPVANEIGQVEDAQAAANRTSLATIQGDTDALTAARQARETQTAGLRARAFSNTTPTDAGASLDKVDAALRSPEAQTPAVADALRDARDRLFQHDPITGALLKDADGNPMLITDPEQLWGVRRGIAADMTRMSPSSRTDMRLASRQLQPVLDQLDKDIEAGAPGYAGFNQAYREASKPITAMEYLQGRNLVDTATQTPQLAAVQRTLDDIARQRSLKAGWQPADDLSDAQIAGLEALRDQLRRQWNLRRGMSIGSPTYQKFSTNQMTNMLMGPVMRYGRSAIAGALGVHEFGPVGMGLGLGEAAIEQQVARSQMLTRQRLDAAITRLLMNRNGEGVAALRGNP